MAGFARWKHEVESALKGQIIAYATVNHDKSIIRLYTYEGKKITLYGEASNEDDEPVCINAGLVKNVWIIRAKEILEVSVSKIEAERGAYREKVFHVFLKTRNVGRDSDSQFAFAFAGGPSGRLAVTVTDVLFSPRTSSEEYAEYTSKMRALTYRKHGYNDNTGTAKTEASASKWSR